MNLDKRAISGIHGGVRYSTATATVLASDEYWDGHNFERQGRNTFLLRGKSGRYFAAHLTMWQGERDHIEPLEEGEAAALYEQLAEHPTEFKEAFPNRVLEEA